MKTIPDQHLFTVCGRPVMFRKTGMFFGALHAIERGYFPVSHTGYYSLAQFTFCARDQHIEFPDLLSENFLASIAAGQQRQTNEVLREVTQCSRQNAANRYTFIHCAHFAALAFDHGLFATDTLRRQLWQAAHETYSNLFDSIFVQQAANDRQNPLRGIETDRQTFDALCRCMNGDFSPDKTSSAFLPAIHMTSYCELPPRPGGEPVITAPTRTLMFDFGN
jgi:hypothetical protein